MAQTVFVFPVTIPPGTAKSAPQKTDMTFPPRTVEKIEIQVPPGPRGEVGFAIGSKGVQIIPDGVASYIVTDGEVIGWEVEDQMDSGGWQLIAYNTGLYSHTITVRFLVNLPKRAGRPMATPIPADQLGAVASTPPLSSPTLALPTPAEPAAPPSLPLPPPFPIG